jgi:hypothetical protein
MRETDNVHKHAACSVGQPGRGETRLPVRLGAPDFTRPTALSTERGGFLP